VDVLMALPLDDPDWRLRWPRDLFIAELQSVRLLPVDPGDPVWLLLREAFSGPAPADAAKGVGVSGYDQTLGGLARRALAVQLRRQAVDELFERQGELREVALVPYRINRLREVANANGPDWERAKRDFIDLFAELDRTGYFDRSWGMDCVDNPRASTAVTTTFTNALGIDGLYPFVPAAWSQDLFLSIVEVTHDAAARPRIIERYHDFGGCGAHYGSYAGGPGQAVFRFRMARIFASCQVPFRIARSGEDLGRVVAVSDDAREDLIASAPDDVPATERDEVIHAIALFRARGATREHRRSAIAVLARVLESHRSTLKMNLLKRDEGALFQLANEFDIRHRKDGQKTEYDDAFLDWVFWWYLGTIELLSRLRERDKAAL
jgi:hypothetical protein